MYFHVSVKAYPTKWGLLSPLQSTPRHLPDAVESGSEILRDVMTWSNSCSE